ncbi:Endonuclease domain-containing 1 protein [Anabarilius grahami]|uniref:Endonuclease domain-containing 1 protein n=1 Tax=Anabarilius grahami TaxID=495550 RepID=A0A3N0XV52_ANAGA|nr:Endonuclease domain-containing 1 protein [Anabarilius grahami]
MFVPALCICIVLRALGAQARVTDDFECKEFFYKNTEPEGMNQNAKKICQFMASFGPLYATLYLVYQRIPLYSAYIFDPLCFTDSGRTNVWHLEPQLSQPQDLYYMVRETQKNKKEYKEKQAISDDYRDTGYDRGHLYPNSFQYGEGRMATNTLTNAAPMDECFNQNQWKKWENKLRTFLRDTLRSDEDNATAYIVTGTVPNPYQQIPQREISDDPERVTVPSHIWTAVCYKHLFNDRKNFISKRDTSEVSDAVECLLVPEKQNTAADGTQCGIVSKPSDGCQCNTRGGIKPCCSTPCLYQDNHNSYRCYSGQTLTECSPQYSLITYTGERCKDDHPCATYGQDYYWCSTIAGSWDYCSPPLWTSKAINGKYCRSNHACGTYGSGYMWCYTDYDNWDYCCTSDNCYSAQNGQTCRFKHPCGFHGKHYLWCYTDDDNSWDYCCSSCQ